MLFAWFSWKFIKLGFFISSVFTFIFFLFQFIRIDQILFNLPLKDSLPFVLVWIFYNFCYFLPTSLFIAFTLTLFEFKEDKKLYVLLSFGVSPFKIYTKALIYSTFILLALISSFLLVKEEDIKSIKQALALKYYTYMLTSLPPGAFQSVEGYTLYVEEREGNKLKDIFFKFPEGAVVAQEAQVSEGSITFKNGALAYIQGRKVLHLRV